MTEALLTSTRGNDWTLSSLNEICSEEEAAVRRRELQFSKGENLREGAASSV